MDTAVLKQRIENAKSEIGFYKDAIEMLIEKYRISNYLNLEMMGEKFPDMPTDVLVEISNNKMPTEEMMNLIDIKKLDMFIQDSLCLVGLILGIQWLGDQEEKDEEVKAYINMLMEFNKREELFLQTMGFAAITLTQERPPSGTMLERMFPISESDFVNSISADLISEMHCDLVFKYRRDKPLLKITRNGL